MSKVPDSGISSHFLSSLPEQPGIYQFFDSGGRIIYIGKAKNLKKRVSSYFNRNTWESAKVRTLVSKIVDIKYIVVNTESDALILENILIKKHQPKYNILLRDDKTYPWITIKNEPFPRIITTRKYEEDGSIYYGPYTSVRLLKVLIELVRQLFPLRTCDYPLTKKNIQAKKFKPCLEFQIGNCLAPCIANQTEEEYLKNVESIKKILQGNLNEVMVLLNEEMLDAARNLKFEKANIFKERIKLLKNFQAKSSVISKNIENINVFTIVEHDGFVVVNYLRINGGVLIQSYNLQVKSSLDESIEDIFSQTIFEISERLNIKSGKALANMKPGFEVPNFKLSVPRYGDRLDLVKLSIRNAEAYIKELQKNEMRMNPQQRYLKYLIQLQSDLHLPDIPDTIECFDNSNLQGTNPVSSCVVFTNGKPNKKEYRHFNIKSVEGPDDYASMREVVYRRYKRLLDEEKPLPKLVVIDGGKGQLAAAYDVFKELGIERVPLIGIAKRLEEIYQPGDSTPIYLDKRSMSLKLIQQIRDEAHRFGITFHRKKRVKGLETSILEGIPGVGKRTVEKLYTKFKSLDNIKRAQIVDLADAVGEKTARKILQYLQNNQ